MMTSIALGSQEGIHAAARTRRGSRRSVRASQRIVASMCILLVAAADWLFYRHTLGCTAAIFAGALLAAVSICSNRWMGSVMGRVVGAAYLLLCLCLLDQPGPLRITMAILCLTALASISARGWTSSVIGWIGRWMEYVGGTFYQLIRDSRITHRWAAKHGGGKPGAARMIVRWVAPVLLSVVFVALFAMANPVISKWLGHAGDAAQRFFTNIGEYVTFGRIALWLIVGATTWALLRSRLRLRGERVESQLFSAGAWSGNWPSAGLIVRCLVLFNMVFAVQMGLDLVTLATHGASLPEGVTFREYAHRGAYPLVATALLAAAFVLVAFPTGRDGRSREPGMRAARMLVYAWIIQNILLTASAVWRLDIYVDAFGLTRLRVAAGIWMLLVGMGLFWIIWRLARERTNRWLLRVNFATLMTVLLACCTVNWERLIASHDAGKCYEVGGPGPRIDLDYLRELGPDSIPTLDRLAGQIGPSDDVGRKAAILAQQLRDDVHSDLQTWQGWTYRRWQLAGK